MIAIDLSKQGLDADPKSIQQIDFKANLERWKWKCNIFFFLENSKETVSDFSQGTVKVF